MQYLYKVCFCCALLAVLYEDSSAEGEDKSDEIREINDRTLLNISESAETEEGPPDSHEAMNNREINPIIKTRQKRSYEFLMGLINNNSRYQVTRDEPSINLSKKQRDSKMNIGASELLLELLVKIAANPDQWNRVHQLLRQIDKDISTSKQLIEDYRNHTLEIQNLIQEKPNEMKQVSPREKTEEKKSKKYIQAEINKEIAITSDNGQPDVNTKLFGDSAATPTVTTRRWPTFSYEDPNVNFIDTDTSSNSLTDSVTSSYTGFSSTKSYPKYFSYHRVTGKPVFINKDLKAYVAVSVVAPKSPSVTSNEDLELEHELRQLKPWSHSRNLKNMESIRSRWVIDSEKFSDTPEKA